MNEPRRILRPPEPPARTTWQEGVRLRARAFGSHYARYVLREAFGWAISMGLVIFIYALLRSLAGRQSPWSRVTMEVTAALALVGASLRTLLEFCPREITVTPEGVIVHQTSFSHDVCPRATISGVTVKELDASSVRRTLVTTNGRSVIIGAPRDEAMAAVAMFMKSNGAGATP